MDKERIVKIVDIVVLIAVALITGVYGCLDVFDVREVDYALLTFVLLMALLLHFIGATFLELDLLKRHGDIATKIDRSTKTIIDSLHGVEIRLFDKIEDVDLYIAERIATAKKNVYDLNWQDYLKANPNPRNPVVREYTENAIDKSIKDFCTHSDGRVYREVFTFSHARNVQKMLQHITYGSPYSCSYYDNAKHPRFPKIQFVIVDDEEVIFVSSSYSPHFCAIHDKRVVSIFNNYFTQAWSLSKVIKDGPKVKEEIVSKIKETYAKGVS